MSATTTWRLGCVVACLVTAAQPAGCGNTTSNGNTPPVNGGTDDGGGGDATPDGSGMPGEGGGPEGSVTEGGSGDGGPMGDASKDAGNTNDGAPVDGSGGDGGGVDGGMDAGLTTDAPMAAPDGGVLCVQGETWGPPVAVLTTASADQTVFGAVTPDELTIAWTSSTGGVVTAWYADRASTGVAFGSPQALGSTFGTLSFDRVSLSGDGLRIVGISSNSAGFVAAKRSARTGPFDTDDSAEFSGVSSGEGVMSTFATPLLAPDDAFFFYIVTNSTTNDVVYETPGGPPWTPGAFLATTQLQRVGTQYRRPTGMSGDDLALFYWDETTSTESIAFRQNPAGDFNFFVNLGAMQDAVPTANCARLYYSTPATGGAINIVYADGTKPDN